MRVATVPPGLSEIRAAHDVTGGQPLTATLGMAASFIPLTPFGTIVTDGRYGATWVGIMSHNAATSATTARFLLNPWLTTLYTQDDGVSFSEHSANMHDNNTTTDFIMGAMSTLANGDAIYCASHMPFAGIAVEVGGTVNAEASTLTAAYWNGVAWVSLGASDGTAAAGATLGQTGLITWTVPAAWKSAALVDVLNLDKDVPTYRALQFRDKLYWTRISVSAALTAATEVSAMLAINRSTAYAELPTGATIDLSINVGYGGSGCIQALTDTGTMDLIVNVAMVGDNGGFS